MSDELSMSMFVRSTDFAKAKADNLILGEIALQDRMWGETNERADITSGQLFDAARAQASLVHMKRIGFGSDDAINHLKQRVYPQDWSGFRDYGSDVANLVVAAAYLRQEIVRRIRNGESTERTSRNPVTQPYNPASGLPNAIES